MYLNHVKIFLIRQFVDSSIQKTFTITAQIAQTQSSLNYSIATFLSQREAGTIALLITITNYKIRKARNAKIHQNINSNARLIVAQIKKAISRQYRLELQKIVQPHLPIL